MGDTDDDEFGTAAEVPAADTNDATEAAAAAAAAAEPILQQEAAASHNNADGLINLEGIMAELQNWQNENNNLAIPSSHPVSSLFICCL